MAFEAYLKMLTSFVIYLKASLKEPPRRVTSIPFLFLLLWNTLATLNWTENF